MLDMLWRLLTGQRLTDGQRIGGAMALLVGGGAAIGLAAILGALRLIDLFF